MEMTLETAVVGAGTVSATHFAGVQKNPRTNLVAICDVDASKAQAAATEYDCRAYTDLDELLAQESLDWLHICTPVQTHLDIAKQAIEAGVPLLIEKPVTETVAELEELEAFAERHGVPVSPVHQHLYDPAMRKARNMIENGEIGRIRGVDLVSAGHSRPDDTKRGRWVFDLLGGEFEEGLPHPIYMGLAMGGFPSNIDSVHTMTELSEEYEQGFAYDTVQLQYASADGVLCSMKIISGATLKRQIHVHGSDGALIIDTILQNVQKVDGGYGDSSIAKAMQSIDYSIGQLTGLASNARLVAQTQFNDDWGSVSQVRAHYGLFDQTAKALDEGGPLPVSLDSSKWTIRLMEAIRNAAEDQQRTVQKV